MFTYWVIFFHYWSQLWVFWFQGWWALEIPALYAIKASSWAFLVMMELLAVYCRVREYPGRIPTWVITFSWLKMSSGNCYISLLGKVISTHGVKFVKWLRVKQNEKDLQKFPFNPHSLFLKALWDLSVCCHVPLNVSDPDVGALLEMAVPHHRMVFRKVVLFIMHKHVPTHKQGNKQNGRKRNNKRIFKVFFVGN